MSKHDFLFELGCEELPPKALKTLAHSLEASVVTGLNAAELSFDKIEQFAAPRRLGLRISGLSSLQPDKIIERRGPAVQAAFDAQGKATKAAEGFARGLGVTVDALQRLETDKGSWLYFELKQPGKGAAELLPDILNDALNQLPIPKRMRWGASRAEFVRPVHWLVMLLDDQVIPATLLGKTTDRKSFGHRFHHPGPVTIDSPSSYEDRLREAKVLVRFTDRQALIQQQVLIEAEKIQAKALIDPDLLDEVTALVEWPVTMTGQFEQRFLEVPSEALISSMQEHQKYFPVVAKDSNDVEPKLLPHFIFVSNLESKDPSQVIQGNEKVIRPRLADAAFFWETDLKQPLSARVEALGKVLFQKELGTLLEKTQRVQRLAGWLAQKLQSNIANAERAAWLCKADLISEMVFEFDDMQGIAGRYYAQQSGEPSEVATAIMEHYLPKQAGDALPSTSTGQMVALADRIDTLIGIFGIGQIPTGAKDPFGLRRSSLGVLRILIEKSLDLDLKEALQFALEGYQQQAKPLKQADSAVEKVLSYALDRLSALYQDQGIPVEVFQAVRARHLSNPLDIDLRVKAVHRFYQQEAAQALASASKRVSNLLAKAKDEIPASANKSLLQEPTEQALYAEIIRLTGITTPLFEKREYQQALDQLSSLREAVDNFFEQVMVMTEDQTARQNRLALLSQLRALFLHIAEISHLQVGQ